MGRERREGEGTKGMEGQGTWKGWGDGRINLSDTMEKWASSHVAISRCHNYKAERGFKRGDMDPLSVRTANSEATGTDRQGCF